LSEPTPQKCESDLFSYLSITYKCVRQSKKNIHFEQKIKLCINRLIFISGSRNRLTRFEKPIEQSDKRFSNIAF
jgi:hypothetical protein